MIKKLLNFALLLCMLVLGAGNVWGENWTRCTSVSDLTSGGTFIIGYEATANSGKIIPMKNTGGTATTSAAGYMASGSEIDMATVTETTDYEFSIVASTTVNNAICIKCGDNFIGNTNTKNNCKLFAEEANTTSFNVTVDANDVFTLKIEANATYHTLQYNTSSPRFAVYGGTQKNLVIYKYSSGDVEKTKTITAFNGESAYTVTIGENFTAPTATVSGEGLTGASVTYASSTESVATVDANTGAVTIVSTGSTTITATYAGNDNYKGSSASYTLTVKEPITTVLTSMEEIFAKATEAGSTATDVKVAFNNWVVSGVKGNNAYVTDGTKGFIVYTKDHGFVAGDILNGTVACKVQLYKGSAELTELSTTTEGITVTKGGVLAPQAISIADLSGTNTGAVISFDDLTYNGTAFTDGTNTITPYGTFITLPSLVNGKKYNVTGVYIQYNETKEIAPRTEADIEEIADEQQTYHITTAEDIQNGTVKASSEEATEGIEITLTATPAEGYEFEAWDVRDAENNAITVTGGKFTMPASNVIVSATFKEKENTGTDDGDYITLNFTENNWGLPEGSTNKATDEASFTDGTYTITLSAPDNYYFNTNGYLMLGKKDATLTLPAFDFDVEKIVVCGTGGASTSVGQNIYVGEEAVSKETAGAKNAENEYIIGDSYQTAGNLYTLKVTTAHNTQISWIKVYKKATPTTGTISFVAQNEGVYYATFSSDKDVIFPLDGNVVVSTIFTDGEDILIEEINAENGWAMVTDPSVDDSEGIWGTYVPANTGVLLTSTETTGNYYFVKDYEWNQKQEISADNMLRPASAEMTGDYKFYKLAYDDYDNKTGLGFYWGAADGAAFTCKAGTAYLAVPTETAANVKGFTLGTATGIQEVESVAKAGKIFDLQGRQLNAVPTHGLYIQNGRKMFVK